MEKAVLFDLDGTLTDPFEGISRCITYALKTMDVPVPDKDSLREWIGPPLKGSFRSYFESVSDRAVEEARVNRAVTLYRQRFTDKGLYENCCYPGIDQVLGTLSDTGYQLFLATAKPTIYAEKIVAHFQLDQWLDGVYGSELDGMRSDKTELLAYLLEKETLNPESCIMIGDRHQDMLAADNHGIYSMGVLWGYGSMKELEQAGAHQVLTGVADLVPAINLIFKNLE